PGFVTGAAPDYVERPLLLKFLESTTIDSVLTLNDPSKVAPLDGFDRVAMARVSWVRTVSGATLTTSLQVITNSFQPLSTPFGAPLAMQISLEGSDLSGAATKTVGASSQAGTLTWSNEASYSASDYIVTLYEITNSRLAPVHIYHVLAAAAKIDRSLLQPQH